MSSERTSTHEIFYFPLMIRENHLDTFGHVNNATYLEILEEARWELITDRGFGLKVIQEMQIGPTILAINMKYKRELTLRQEIIIETQALEYPGKVGTIRQDIVDKEKKVYFEATLTIGLFDLQKRKLISPTPEWLYAIGMT